MYTLKKKTTFKQVFFTFYIPLSGFNRTLQFMHFTFFFFLPPYVLTQPCFVYVMNYIWSIELLDVIVVLYLIIYEFEC